MARILIVNVAAQGHINPTLPVTEELVRRGEEVTYAAPFEVEAAVTATGAAFAGYESTIGKVPGKMPTPGDMRSFRLPLMLLEEFEQVWPVLLEHAKAVRPDIVAYDFMTMAGRALAEVLKVPQVRLHSSYAGNEHWSMMKAAAAAGMAFDPAVIAEIQQRAAKLSERFGLSCMTFPGILADPGDRNIVFMPRAFQPSGDTFDERFIFVGPSIKERPAAGDFPLAELDRGTAPILFISLGTVFNNWPEFFDMCFQAFGGTEWRVVLSTGERVDADVLARAPANFLARRHVPQLDVLKRAKVFVTHGGMNSTMEALAFGVPLVVVPQMPEQGVTSRRVAELGLGLALTRETTTASALRAAVLRLSSEPSFAVEVARMQSHIHDAGGYPRAAEAIIELGRTAAG